jgi:hypothetical protein
MIKEFFERVHYEGYTHTELEQAAGGGGGGGKSNPIGGVASSISDAWEDTKDFSTKAAGDVGDWAKDPESWKSVATAGLYNGGKFVYDMAHPDIPDSPTSSAQASTNLGGGLSTGGSPLLKEEDKKPKIITKKKKGTRGLQIPTTTPTVNTTTTPTVNTTAGTGIQI